MRTNKLYSLFLFSGLYIFAMCQSQTFTIAKASTPILKPNSISNTSTDFGTFPYHINTVIDGIDSNLSIDASVENIPENIYSCTVLLAEPTLSDVKSVLLDNYKSSENLTSIETSTPSVDPDSPGSIKSLTLINGIDNSEVALITSVPDGLISYINYDLDKKYPDNTSASLVPTEEINAPNTLLTREVALSQAGNIIAALNGPNCIVKECLPFATANNKGYYLVSFVPTFHDTPLISGLPGFSYSNIYEIWGSMILTEDGILELMGNFLVNYESEVTHINALTYDEIIDSLETAVSLGRIIPPENLSVTNIQFGYLPKKAENIELVPVWHFFFESPSETPQSPSTWTLKAFGINAINGDIEFIY